MTAIQDRVGNRVEYLLDPMGNRTQESWKDTGGTLKRTLTRVIDALNRVQTVTGGAAVDQHNVEQSRAKISRVGETRRRCREQQWQ